MLPYLTKQVNRSLRDQGRQTENSRNLMKSKSKSFSDIQQILAQKGSKCICFNIYGTVTGANLDKNCGDYCKKLAPNI